MRMYGKNVPNGIPKGHEHWSSKKNANGKERKKESASRFQGHKVLEPWKFLRGRPCWPQRGTEATPSGQQSPAGFCVQSPTQCASKSLGFPSLILFALGAWGVYILNHSLQTNQQYLPCSVKGKQPQLSCLERKSKNFPVSLSGLERLLVSSENNSQWNSELGQWGDKWFRDSCKLQASQWISMALLGMVSKVRLENLPFLFSRSPMEMGEERKENTYVNENGSWWLITDHKNVKNETMIVLIVTWPELNVPRRRWRPTPVLSPGKSHGQRSLVGCSPWGREESDTTEWLPFHFSVSWIEEGNGNPLQCSCLENPRDGGTWWAARLWGRTESDMTEVT